MIKAGKKTKEWNKVRLQVKKYFIDQGITTCEIRLKGCTNNYPLSFAHTKKRRFVTDLSRVVLCCLECHHKVEYQALKYTGQSMEDYLESIITNRLNLQ